MKQDGLYEGEGDGDYNLPVCDVDKERRNFPGYETSQPMADVLTDTFGTTDTDSKTSGKDEKEGYSKIYGGGAIRRTGI